MPTKSNHNSSIAVIKPDETSLIIESNLGFEEVTFELHSDTEYDFPMMDKEKCTPLLDNFKFARNCFCLSDINLEIQKGEFVAVVGAVGSGKSSFLNALIWEMTKTSGKIHINGSVAFCPQVAWVQNSTGSFH